VTVFVSSDDNGSDISLNDEILGRDMLYDNASVTVEEAMLGLCDVYLKNRLSKTALSDMIKYTQSILPEGNVMPRNCNELFNYIKSQAPRVEKGHLYCPDCLVLKDKKVINA